MNQKEMLELIIDQVGEVNNRLDGIDSRLDGIDSRLDGVDSRLDGIDNRLDGMEVELKEVKVVVKENSQEIRNLHNQTEIVARQVGQNNEILRQDNVQSWLELGSNAMEKYNKSK